MQLELQRAGSRRSWTGPPAALEVQADRGQQERQCIGEVVPGIRQQCETMGTEAGKYLDGCKCQGRDQRKAEYPTRAVRVVMMSHVMKRPRLFDDGRDRFYPLLPTLR